MQVEAAAAAHAVQRFAHKVKAGTALELEIRFQLGEGKAAAGDLRLLPAAGGQAVEPPVFGDVGQLLPLGGGEPVHIGVRQAGGLPQGTAQLGVQQAQPEVCRRIARQQGYAGGEQRGKCVLGNVREEVQLHGRVFHRRGQVAGQVHDADAGQAVVGELHLAPVICQQGAAVVQGGVGLGPDAGQTLVRLCTLQSGQAGVQRGQCTAALGGEPGAEAVGAELRPGTAAHGTDHGIGP